MNSVLFLINTFNRPDRLLALLRQVSCYSQSYAIEIVIFEDKSKADYTECTDLLSNNANLKHSWYRTGKHAGKKNYWQVIDSAYSILKNKTFDYMVHLPDDVLLTDDFIFRSISLYELIPDRRKICLNLLCEINRNNPGWTNLTPKHFSQFINTGWVDMCFIATNRYLKALNFGINPVDPEWSGNPERSSGVGLQISRRLVKQGYNLYQVKRSLVIHGIHDSVMHPEHRKENPIITNNMHIVASMASMPSREKSLAKVVDSILPQVSELWIYLNDYTRVPHFLKLDKIRIFRSQNELGDLGDAGKFYNCEEIDGYHFTIDDDLIYPPDYVSRMVASIERHNRKYAITCHGRRFGSMPVASYYRGATENYACLQGQLSDAMVHVGGTGVMAYHTSVLKLSIADFEAANMADIWFAKAANEQGVNILSIAHRRGWIKESVYDRNYTIFSSCSNSDAFQTQVINSIDFKELPVL